MTSFEKLKILTPFQKLPKNVGDLGKIIVANGFEKLPKVQLIAQSGHSGGGQLRVNSSRLDYTNSRKSTDKAHPCINFLQHFRLEPIFITPTPFLVIFTGGHQAYGPSTRPKACRSFDHSRK